MPYINHNQFYIWAMSIAAVATMTSQTVAAQNLIGLAEVNARSGFIGDTAIVLLIDGVFKGGEDFGHDLVYVPHRLDPLTGELHEIAADRPLRLSKLFPWHVRCFPDHYTVYAEALDSDSLSRHVERLRFDYDGTLIDSTRWLVPLVDPIFGYDYETQASFYEENDILYFFPIIATFGRADNYYVYALADTGVASAHFFPTSYMAQNDARLYQGRYVIMSNGTFGVSPPITVGTDQLDSIGYIFEPFDYDRPDSATFARYLPRAMNHTLVEYDNRLYAYGMTGTSFGYTNRIPYRLTEALIGVVVDSTLAVVDTATFLRDYRMEGRTSSPGLYRSAAVDREGRFYASVQGNAADDPNREATTYVVRHDADLNVVWEVSIPMPHGKHDVFPLGEDRVWILAFQILGTRDDYYIEYYSYLIGPEGLISSAPVAKKPLPTTGHAVPNPVHERFRIGGLDDADAISLRRVEVYDASGRLVHAQDTASDGAVDIAELVAGEYVAVAYDAHNRALTACRVVKQ